MYEGKEKTRGKLASIMGIKKSIPPYKFAKKGHKNGGVEEEIQG